MQIQRNQQHDKLTAKPFVKWVGGKGQLIQTFEGLLPTHLESIDKFTYVEPFVGGGAMLFSCSKIP